MCYSAICRVSVILPGHFDFMIHSVLVYPLPAECDTHYFEICQIIELGSDTVSWSNRNDSSETSI